MVDGSKVGAGTDPVHQVILLALLLHLHSRLLGQTPDLLVAHLDQGMGGCEREVQRREGEKGRDGWRERERER